MLEPAPLRPTKMSYEAWQKWIEREADEAEYKKPTPKNDQLSLQLSGLNLK